MQKSSLPTVSQKRMFTSFPNTLIVDEKGSLTVGRNVFAKVFVWYEISKQVFPTPSSPTTTHFISLAIDERNRNFSLVKHYPFDQCFPSSYVHDM